MVKLFGNGSVKFIPGTSAIDIANFIIEKSGFNTEGVVEGKRCFTSNLMRRFDLDDGCTLYMTVYGNILDWGIYDSKMMGVFSGKTTSDELSKAGLCA